VFKSLKNKTENKIAWLVIIIGLIALIVGAYAIISWTFMFLWNVIAEYFGWIKLTYWISVVIVLFLGTIKNILFPSNNTNSNKQ
jgi:hypothetical protein